MKQPSRKQQIIEYLRNHLGEKIHNQQLRDLTGLNDVPRTIRQLRQDGWDIDVHGDGYVTLISSAKGVARGKRKAVSERLRYEIFNRDGFKCQACGRGISDGVKLVIDHRRPVDWGGTNDISNLETLCEECNRGKKAWLDSMPSQNMSEIMSKQTVEARIEALFDNFPNQDIPSEMIRLVSGGALDWQRALRRIRQRSGKNILSVQGRSAYRYLE
ncbi:MAG TPA: HNH endonuclease [Dehalococcoidia bacterium]|nr:HNH endonuclease [Dehalococcoidia bacterium]